MLLQLIFTIFISPIFEIMIYGLPHIILVLILHCLFKRSN